MVKVVSKFITNPNKKQWEVMKGEIWYLSGMISKRLCLRVSNTIVIGFSDIDYVEYVDNMKSTLGFSYSYRVWSCQ